MPKALQPAAPGLYDQDFFEWTVRNAELLRAGRTDEADLEHIAEEIEDMGKSQRHELHSRLRVLLIHLLKWRFQPKRRGPSWTDTIDTQRAEMEDLFDSAPSLRSRLDISRVYQRALIQAARESGLARQHFPPTCPFSLEQILDTEFFPD